MLTIARWAKPGVRLDDPFCIPTIDGKSGDPVSLVWPWTGNQGSWTQRCRDKPFLARGGGAAAGPLSGTGQHRFDPVTHIAGHPPRGVLGEAAKTFLSLEDSSSPRVH